MEDLDRIAEMVKRIKETAVGKREADVRLDDESLNLAAALDAVYAEMRWVDDMPPPKKVKGRGRRIDPKSRQQFAKWVRQRFEWGSQPRLAQLHDAFNFHNQVMTIKPVGERSVRPLWKLRDQGYGEHIPEVWDAACKLASGAPASADTQRAVREFLEAHKPPIANTASDPRTAAEIRAARKKRLLAEFDAVMAEENRTAKDLLNEMIAHFNEHQRELKAS